jgi:hypothetical protein
LIHGSVLVERSANAVELPGICDLSRKSVPIDQLIGSWIDAISYRFKWRFHAAALSDEEQQLALHWRDTRFASPAWNLKR